MWAATRGCRRTEPPTSRRRGRATGSTTSPRGRSACSIRSSVRPRCRPARRGRRSAITWRSRRTSSCLPCSTRRSAARRPTGSSVWSRSRPPSGWWRITSASWGIAPARSTRAAMHSTTPTCRRPPGRCSASLPWTSRSPGPRSTGFSTTWPSSSCPTCRTSSAAPSTTW